ncbi:succinate-semialdehyde dehydrogenase [Thermus composti]|uniref:Zinc-binding dehydrogenase n=1 Tax=Thermus composti TaxID=532059 RepID=A0ABV6Q1X2_9DEIN|nr:alcohol dehydrogenase catalytic domain-containing protein [Thermus composti]GGN04449.1 succinate-semialdehyde dehydrogenase [Thermus composti]
MRAAVLEGVGSPLRVEEVPIPEPKAGEVLVKVAACGVCHTDLHVIKGEVAFPTPCVLGHEISGTVAALGPGVEGLKEGQRVVASFIMPCGTCYYCVRGEEDLCERFFAFNRLKGVLYDGTTRLFRKDGSPLWMYSMGGLAEYAVVPATDVFPLPEGLPLEEAAILGCALFTALGAVRTAGLEGGESVAVVATGGVGLGIVQLARAFGAYPVVAIDLRPEKLQKAKALGASHAFTPEEAQEGVRALTEGRGVDVAFEALGRPETFRLALSLLRDGGRMVPVGIAPSGVEAGVEITRLVRRKLKILGSYGAKPRRDMPTLLKLAQVGSLGVGAEVTERFTLEEADLAYRRLDRGEIVGRAVVVMGR